MTVLFFKYMDDGSFEQNITFYINGLQVLALRTNIPMGFTEFSPSPTTDYLDQMCQVHQKMQQQTFLDNKQDCGCSVLNCVSSAISVRLL